MSAHHRTLSVSSSANKVKENCKDCKFLIKLSSRVSQIADVFHFMPFRKIKALKLTAKKTSRRIYCLKFYSASTGTTFVKKENIKFFFTMKKIFNLKKDRCKSSLSFTILTWYSCIKFGIFLFNVN
jgi:hypothetical protein